MNEGSKSKFRLGATTLRFWFSQRISRRMTVTNMNHSQTARGPLVRRHTAWTRITHWVWAASVFFLIFSGLQIFNAHPTLYIGQQSGFEFDNAVLSIGAIETPIGLQGRTRVFGRDFDTSGFLRLSGPSEQRQVRGFPAALTIPSYQDLATGRVVHFFFAWLFVAGLFSWLTASLINGHIRRDLIPTAKI